MMSHGIKYVVTVLVVFIFTGCLKDSLVSTQQKTATLGESFDIKIGETVSIRNEQLNFQFVDVPEDSRCPLGLMCFWAGNAAVIIKIQDLSDTVNTSLEPKAVIHEPYTITLLQLSPYPKIGEPRDRMLYTAQFIVMKK
ncbi:MAG: hypothetical protein EHM64_16395 [Ignavibacteriae bacterium]|nr:MAG: hypothetical protein EHM64_16395 [Ignavibacteriota bacterium]